ncbi:MAG: exodeoxyribonuclease VII large subunit, partial [Proteobacteria bacterium]
MSLDLFDSQLATDGIFSVGDLNQHIKRVLSADPIASDVAVTGEISNFKLHSSGHCYFSLKDDRAQIRCTMWRSAVGKLSFRPSDGDKVICSTDVIPPLSVTTDPGSSV